MKELLEYREKLLARLETSVRDFRAAYRGHSDPSAPLEAGGWNVHKLAAHTRDVEKYVYGMRMRITVAQDNPEFQDFDADDWMAANYDPEEPLASILDELSASVEETATWLRDLPPEVWSRVSSHETYRGSFTLQTWVERALAHIQEHLRAVQKQQEPEQV